MFRAKTVFVIGAGASSEIGLPIGDQLLGIISRALNIKYHEGKIVSGDIDVFNALSIIIKGMDWDRDEEGMYQKYLSAARQISKSCQQAISIDNIIDALEDKEIELMGKLGIVCSILNAEKQSSFSALLGRDDVERDFSIFSMCWHGFFTKILCEGVRKSNISSIFDNIEIINFNYDRCIEYYLPFSLSNYYGIDEVQAREVVGNLKIHRPYGRIGNLPWEQGVPKLSFGGNPEKIAEISQYIKTFTESVEDESGVELIRNAISSADRIVFLGFAFHRQNLKLISGETKENVHILATTYKVSESDKRVIRDEIFNAFDIKLYRRDYALVLNDMTCKDFFQNNWRVLTSGVL